MLVKSHTRYVLPLWFQWVCLLVAAVLTLVGIAGYIVTVSNRLQLIRIYYYALLLVSLLLLFLAVYYWVLFSYSYSIIEEEWP